MFSTYTDVILLVQRMGIASVLILERSNSRRGARASPFLRAELWRGGVRNFWRGVKKGVPSEKNGGYPTLDSAKLQLGQWGARSTNSKLVLQKVKGQTVQGQTAQEF